MKVSLGGKTLAPAPVYIVGTYDEKGRANVMAAAWAGICCSKPPCLAVSLREATYSYHNILEMKAFTVNIPGEDQATAADYFGLASGRDGDKLAATGLTAVKSELVDAPYIEEFPLVLECSLFRVVELGLHTMFVGEIRDVKAEESVLGEKKTLDLGRVKPFIFSPGDRLYYRIGEKLGPAFSIGEQYRPGQRGRDGSDEGPAAGFVPHPGGRRRRDGILLISSVGTAGLPGPGGRIFPLAFQSPGRTDFPSSGEASPPARPFHDLPQLPGPGPRELFYR
jgi:flavin reductase (DIM6/NTAB) family NADH-FMN oxidoreductase RutF